MKSKTPVLLAGIAASLTAPHLLADLSWETEAAFSAVADSEFRGGGFRGEVNAVDFGLRAVASKQFGGGPLFRFGLEWQRADFGLSKRAPLPNTLQSLAAVVGADFQFGEAWLFRLEAMPGFYSGGTDVHSGDFNVPVIFGGSYFVNADLQFVAGLEVDVNRKYPVLGAIGVRWKFAPKFVLNAVVPTPRLEYSFSKTLTGYIGADLRETTYRTHGGRRLENAIVDYTQIRVGAGASWKVTSQLTFECEAGVAVVHEFDFHRADIGVRSQDLPVYGGFSLKTAF